MKRILKINKADNVAVTLVDGVKAGEVWSEGDETVTLKEDIVRGHKFALRNIAEGEAVIKYGFPIGVATRDIAAGEWIHSHNLKTVLATICSIPILLPNLTPPRVTSRLRSTLISVLTERWVSVMSFG